MPSCKYCDGKRWGAMPSFYGTCSHFLKLQVCSLPLCWLPCRARLTSCALLDWRVFPLGQNILSSMPVVILVSCPRALLLETSKTTSLAAADACQPTVSTLLHDPIAKARGLSSHLTGPSNDSTSLFPLYISYFFRNCALLDIFFSVSSFSTT